MNKIVLFFSGLVLLIGINASKLMAQNSIVAHASASVMITATKAAQVQFVNGFSQIVPNSNDTSGRPIILLTENGRLMSNANLNLASFAITGENKNSLYVSLPSQPVLLKNSENTNSLQVIGWQSITPPLTGESQQNTWNVNLGVSLKMKSADDHLSGKYSGTYPVTLVYN